MHGNTIAVLLGAAVAVGYGLADFWAAKASKKIGAVTALVAVDIVLLIGYVPVYLLVPDAGLPMTTSGLAYAVAGGLLLNVASILFFKGLVAGPVSVVSPISAAYPLVSALLAVLAFGAKLSGVQLLAITVIVLGVMAAGGLFAAASDGSQRLGRGAALATVSVIFYGLGYSCLAQASQRIGWQTTTLVEFMALVTAVLLSVPLVAGTERVFADLSKALKNFFVVLCGLSAIATIALFNMGFTYENTGGAITIAVSACYPVITVALALRHFKEEIRLVPLMGAGVTVAGVVVLSLG